MKSPITQQFNPLLEVSFTHNGIKYLLLGGSTEMQTVKNTQTGNCQEVSFDRLQKIVNFDKICKI